MKNLVWLRTFKIFKNINYIYILMGKTYKKNGSGIARSVNYKANKNRKFTKIKYKSSHSSNRNKNKNILNDESFIPFDCKQRLHKHKVGSCAYHENLLNIPNFHSNEFSDDSMRGIYDFINEDLYDNYKPWVDDTLENNLKKIKLDIKKTNNNKFSTFNNNGDPQKAAMYKFIDASLKQLNRRNKVSRFKGHNQKNKFFSKLQVET